MIDGLDLNGEIATAGGIILVFAVASWAVVRPSIALGILSMSLVAGQIIRFPLPGQGGGILISDVALILVILAAAAHITNKKVCREVAVLGMVCTPFIVWSLYILVVHTPQYDMGDVLVGVLYWVRLSCSILLLPALMVFARAQPRVLWMGFCTSVVLLSLFGLAQVIALPDLSSMTVSGWDPHKNRLVSTWLDPNLFGLFLVLCLIAVCVRGIPERNGHPHMFRLWITWALAVTLLIGEIILTRSRSSLGALGSIMLLGVPYIIVRQGRKSPLALFSGFAIFTLVALLIVPVFHDRLLSIFVGDPTLEIRINALAAAWVHLAQDNGFVGVGYNMYQFASHDAGLTSDFTVHSRAGSDNSLLTLLITTGIIGVILFLIPWGYMLLQAASTAYTHPRILLGVASSLIAVGVHSQVVNSALYSHILITLAFVVVLCLDLQFAKKEPKAMSYL